jgi:hypothetical protein
MWKLNACVLIGALCGCAAVPPRQAASKGVNDAPIGSLYLAPASANGGQWCLDPESPTLRSVLHRPQPSSQTLIDARALAADLADLHGLLRTQYAGYGVLAQAPAFDVDAFFAGWRQRLDRDGEVTFEEGVMVPLRRLREVATDQHLSVSGLSRALRANSLLDVQEYQAPLAGSALSLDGCEVEGATRVFADTLRIAPVLSADGRSEPWVTVSASGAGDSVRLRCPAQTFVLKRRTPLAPTGTNEEKEPPYRWHADGDTAVIRISRLGGSTADQENLEQFVRDYPKHARFPHLVFDFRGNGGGNDGYVYRWIAQAKRGLWFSGADTRIIGGLFPCADWDRVVRMQILDGTVDAPAAKALRVALRAKWPSHPPDQREVFRNGLEDDNAQAPYTGTIQVVVDRRSGSSGESAPWVLQHALGATVIGERTAGYSAFGDVVTVVLPRTGVRFNVPTKRNWFSTPMEAVGIPNDVYLADPEAPVDALLPRLSELRKAGAGR